MRSALTAFSTQGRNRVFLCHFFRKSSAKSGLSRNARPSLHYCTRAAHKDRAQGPKVHFINALRHVEALCFSISFESAKRINQSTEGRCACLESRCVSSSAENNERFAQRRFSFGSFICKKKRMRSEAFYASTCRSTLKKEKSEEFARIEVLCADA